MKRHKTIESNWSLFSSISSYPTISSSPSFKSSIGHYYHHQYYYCYCCCRCRGCDCDCYYDCYANQESASNNTGDDANVSSCSVTTIDVSISVSDSSTPNKRHQVSTSSQTSSFSSLSSSQPTSFPLSQFVIRLCCLLTSILFRVGCRPISLESSPLGLSTTTTPAPTAIKSSLIVPALCIGSMKRHTNRPHRPHPHPHHPLHHSHPHRISVLYLLNLIISILCIITFFTLRSSWCLVYDGISEYHSIENDKVSLPCNISAGEWNEAHISLVVWYRSGNKGTPIYSIDARNTLTSSRHQVTPELNGRIKMDFSTMPPVLHIDSVKVSDAGDYRCRVDYRVNRTQQFLIHLNVSVPPKEVVIRDRIGNVVQGLINTPYNEGDKVSLFCDAIGGSPPPMVIWRSNDGQIIDKSYQSLGPETNITRNGLVLTRIDRNHLLQELTCEAFPPVESILSSLTPALSFIESSTTTDSDSELPILAASSTGAVSVTTTTTTTTNSIRRAGHSFIRRSSVALDLNLKPLVVQIQVPKYNVSRSSQNGGRSSSQNAATSSPGFNVPNGRTLIVSAGKMAEIECRSWGSRPPAEITWWRGSRRLPTAASRSETESSSINKVANLTISILSYTALPEDDGQRLTCRADNLQLTNEELEDSVTISVQYAPQLSLSLGAKIPETIREGSDVYFECSVKANPPITEFVWLFEDRPLLNDPASGVLLTNLSLVMQRVRREHRGYYQCLAKNEENVTSSKKVFLNVHFAPVCKPSQTIVFGVARTEHVVIPCEVESEPVTPINFRWFFNNSLESFELSKSDFTVELLRIPVAGVSSEHGKTLYTHPSSSLLSRLSQESMHGITNVQNRPSVARSNATYSPRNRAGYGTLYCLAENSIGIQRDPCSFSIVEAGPPNSVHDCRIVNVTMTSFVLECIPGENGGLPQIFHLEVYNIEKEHLQVNVTSLNSPVFTVENLPHDTAFTLNVFSSNAKGRSDSVTLRTATTAYAEKHTTNGKKQSVLQFDDVNDLILSPMFGALVGALISLLLLCGAIIAFVRHRVCSTKRQITTKEAINLNGVPPNSGAVVEPEPIDQIKDGYGVGHSSTMHSINDYLMRSAQYASNQQQPSQQQQQMSAPAFYRYQPHTGTLPLTLQHSHAGLLTSGNQNQGNGCSRPEQLTMTEMSIVNTAQLDSNNGFYSITNSGYPSNSAAILQHHSQQSQQVTSDLMTNAFTYNVATSVAAGTGNGSLYPISNDLLPVSNTGNNNCNNARTYTEISSGSDMQQHPHHHHHHLATLGTMVGCIDSLSSSTSDKTVEVDEEWRLPKHHMHAHLLGRQPSSAQQQQQPPYMNYSNIRSNESCISSSNTTNSSPSRIANLPKVQFLEPMEPNGSPSKNGNNNNTSITSV